MKCIQVAENVHRVVEYVFQQLPLVKKIVDRLDASRGSSVEDVSDFFEAPVQWVQEALAGIMQDLMDADCYEQERTSLYR